MTDDYDGDLQVLKRSFRGGGEGAFYLRVLEQLAQRPHLDWLDIGVGRDGRALRPFVAFCRSRGQTLAITGIDPDAAAGEWSEEGVRWTLVRGAFQAWCGNGRFDIVNADQSLYYLEDLDVQLGRMAAALEPGGLFVATCWSRDDALHRLRERLFSDAPAALVGEALVERLQAMPQFGPVSRAEFRTEVDLQAWRADPSLLEAAVRVIARAAPCVDLAQRVKTLSTLLDGLGPVGERINLALCVQRL
jgi:SAM-dependent methyltransferase